MYGLNKVILIGTLATTPQLRVTAGGRPMLELRLATPESYTDSQGKAHEKTSYHRVVIWGPRGEALAKFLSRDHRVAIEGRIEYNRWTDRKGVDHNSTNVVATELMLLDRKSDRSDPPATTEAA
jgi:single-strand DNA-binding protein